MQKLTQQLESAGSAADHSLDPSALSSGIHLGRIVGFDDGMPLVRLAGMAAPLPCFACGWRPVADQIGVLVATMLDVGSTPRLILLGPIISFSDSSNDSAPICLRSSNGIKLECGPASVSLRPDGTVSIRGVNVASRASHTNRIRGGNVQIN